MSPLAPPASNQARITRRRRAAGSPSMAVASRSSPARAAGSSSAASTSSASVSSRSAEAVRASASATPPPRTCSSSGSTSVRSRTRVNRGSLLCGSSQAVSPSSAQAARVSARRCPSSGRYHGGSLGRIPAIDRAPEPRPSPINTVSAWSSKVCPSSTGAPCRAPSSARYRAVRAAASGPPACPTCTRRTSARTQPSALACSAAAAATRSESG